MRTPQRHKLTVCLAQFQHGNPGSVFVGNDPDLNVKRDKETLCLLLKEAQK
jgi:hypothetical protein